MYGHYINGNEIKGTGIEYSTEDMQYTQFVNTSKTVEELRAQNEEMRRQNEELRENNKKQLEEMHKSNLRSFGSL